MELIALIATFYKWVLENEVRGLFFVQQIEKGTTARRKNCCRSRKKDCRFGLNSISLIGGLVSLRWNVADELIFVFDHFLNTVTLVTGWMTEMISISSTICVKIEKMEKKMIIYLSFHNGNNKWNRNAPKDVTSQIFPNT